MPTTVRRRTWPHSPATRPQNVAKPGPVKHGRSSPSRHSSEAGRFRPGSTGGFPRHEADVSTADASAFSPPDHAQKPSKPGVSRIRWPAARPATATLQGRQKCETPDLKAAPGKSMPHHEYHNSHQTRVTSGS